MCVSLYPDANMLYSIYRRTIGDRSRQDLFWPKYTGCSVGGGQSRGQPAVSRGITMYTLRMCIRIRSKREWRRALCFLYISRLLDCSGVNTGLSLGFALPFRLALVWAWVGLGLGLGFAPLLAFSFLFNSSCLALLRVRL